MASKQYSRKQKIIFFLAKLFGATLIRLIGYTCRYRMVGMDNLYRTGLNAKQIWAVWHGRMFLPLFHFRNRGVVSLVSKSWDGEVITHIAEKLGYVIRRGSSRDGGREGFNQLVQDVNNGSIVSIFPDGPTGPRHKLSNGVIDLSRLTGASILPMCWSADRVWTFKSWDGYIIPKPFSKGIIIFGDPVEIPRYLSEEQFEEHRQQLRSILCSLEREVDRLATFKTKR